MPDPWFPDYIARWFDLYSAGAPYDAEEQWARHDRAVIETWELKLENNPHHWAQRLDDFVNNSTYGSKAERLFKALRTANHVFHEMGFRIPKINGGDGWKSIRERWTESGNLLREVEGYLVPREFRPYRWSWRHSPAPHTPEAAFPHLARWQPNDNKNCQVRLTVLPTTSVPLIDQTLRIGVVPLVASMSDFKIERIDTDPAYPLFNVSLQDPVAIGAAALNALERAASEQCDVVVLPELSVTESIQEQIQEYLRSRAASRPWLVVAGSARTATGHNRARAFDSQGRCVLTHHKLHRYEMDLSQQERYGIAEVLGDINRYEDIVMTPREIEILDTPAGRLAVLICEDLSAAEFVEKLVVKFALDWLLVPVLDGCQSESRWPARCGQRYADRGAGVVVATSLSMARQHCLTMTSPPPKPGIGLLVLPFSAVAPSAVLSSDQHDTPTIITL